MCVYSKHASGVGEFRAKRLFFCVADFQLWGENVAFGRVWVMLSSPMWAILVIFIPCHWKIILNSYSEAAVSPRSILTCILSFNKARCFATSVSLSIRIERCDLHPYFVSRSSPWVSLYLLSAKPQCITATAIIYDINEFVHLDLIISLFVRLGHEVLV